MLDLTVLVEKYFEIKMPNGEVVSIKKPTQKMALDLSNNKELIEAEENKDIEKVIKIINDRVMIVLNHNKEGRVFKAEELTDLNLDIIKLIVEGYLQWVKDLNNNPN
ncbi:hypothetical protein [Clostridium perfringens]|uniref:hypothetical protein n=1 Tax=Clostridium perfringens TaxID=1502 RepID=UPI0018E43A1B|nr:hypothetical protein [Clostridium perfringens]MBI6050340.1 hypothetical protein [Clostridium perfringens]